MQTPQPFAPTSAKGHARSSLEPNRLVDIMCDTSSERSGPPFESREAAALFLSNNPQEVRGLKLQVAGKVLNGSFQDSASQINESISARIDQWRIKNHAGKARGRRQVDLVRGKPVRIAPDLPTMVPQNVGLENTYDTSTSLAAGRLRTAFNADVYGS